METETEVLGTVNDLAEQFVQSAADLGVSVLLNPYSLEIVGIATEDKESGIANLYESLMSAYDLLHRTTLDNEEGDTELMPFIMLLDNYMTTIEGYIDNEQRLSNN